MTTITSPTATGAATAAGGRNASGLTSAADQQDRFMKLLVAQMKNQDPLNPMDNAQMTSQIAQINTVGGIEKLNGTVQSLLAAFGSMQAQSASELAGRGVLVEGDRLQLQGGVAVGGVQLAGRADAVNVEILDAGGTVVRTLQLGAAAQGGARSFAWDGKLADGSAAPEGAYRIRATAISGGKASSVPTLAGAQVQSVNAPADGTGAQLDLGKLGLVPVSAIRSYF